MACAVQRVVGARGVLPHPQSMGLDDYTMRMIRTLCLAGGRSVATPSLLSPVSFKRLLGRSQDVSVGGVCLTAFGARPAQGE